MEGKESYRNDNQWWSELKKGSEPAFLRLYQSNYQSLFSYGYKMAKDKELAKDAIQDIFFELWKRRGSLPEVANVKAYLFTYLRRKLLKTNQQTVVDLDHLGGQYFEIALSREHLLIETENAHEWQEKLAKALHSLTPRQREIIHLKFYEKLGYEEISEILAVKHQSVLNLTHEALKILRRALMVFVLGCCFVK